MRTRGTGHQETRRQILKAARHLVLKEGHERLSLRQVAKRAGFSPASLYEYFESKEDILRALAADANAELRAALHGAIEAAPKGKERVVRMGLAYVRFAREKSEDFLLLFSRLPSARRDLGEVVPPQSTYRLVLETVSIAVGAGDLKAKAGRDAEQMAYGLWAAVHGMAMLQLTHLAGFEADFAAADRAALEALVDGYRR